MFNFGAQPIPKTQVGFALQSSTPVPATSMAGAAGDTKSGTSTNLFPGSLATSALPAATGFTLPNLAATMISTTTAAPTINFGFSSPNPVTTQTAVKPTLNFSTTQPQSSMPQLGLGTSLGTNVASSTIPSTATTMFTPILSSSSTGTGLSLSTTLTPSSTPLKRGTPTSLTTTASALSTPTSTTTASSSTAPLVPTSSAPSAVLAVATATTPATASVTPSGMTYGQLEDSINKWTVDLEEQGKFFINQARQLNAWDSLLISNGEKMTALSDTIERVKQQQKQLDQELDFVLAQQNELDELSRPLEKELNALPVQDEGRFQMYRLSESIDSQLKQMSEDLKEVVEHLNESNKDEDLKDPVIQVSRILNAHMNSLQWIDRSSAQVSAHLEEISKLQELNRKNQLNF